ncbi:uncharacterized protein LOC125238967 [Leguminivora glycinivorella]|uniref:uncharacterized protein LOC125238967 n=1 Tax=Leguminivora glycinivorella TaxID=1035111 RepID=UPI00200CB719|nr:uncharacterized protein LOC125238967 [Leguminivora glycinivorella]
MGGPPGPNTCAPARVLQANIHHAAAATAIVESQLAGHVDLALLQEPWVRNSDILGLKSVGKVLYNTNGIKPRACIVFSKNIDFLPVPELCTDDLVAAYVNLKGWSGRRVILCSAYLPGEKQDPSADLNAVAEYARRHNAELLVGCDANAHHTNWGSTDINDRGELLHDFLLCYNFQILNLGCEPTFVTRVRKEVLDLTFASVNLARYIQNWRVSDVESLSDHKHICFNISFSLSVQTCTFRDPRRTDWEGYNNSLERNLDSVMKVIKTKESLELAVEVISNGIVRAFEDNCAPKFKSTKRHVPWWNSKLKKLRGKTRKLFNRAKRTNDWETYRKALNEYSKEIRKAKRASWRRFCEEIENTPQGARLHRLLSKARTSQVGLLKRQDGSYTTNELETLELLVETHFPGAALSNSSRVSESLHRPRPEDWRQAATVIRPGIVRWAINSFKTFKTSGLDGVSPLLL